MVILLKLLISLVLISLTVSYYILGNKLIKSSTTISKLKNQYLHKNLKVSILDDIDDEEDLESFQRIASNYLKSKFFDCYGDDCKSIRDRNDVSLLLRNVLPPVTKLELDNVVDNILNKLDKSEISADDFLKEVLSNPYWKEAGFFVVKELIFLDCINTYYFEKRNVLNDNDYNELKEQLTWEGSIAASLKAKEAHFITAVAASRRGAPILNDDDYGKLKAELQQEGSWVVNRQQDPLEKLGINTFLSYLHRSL